MATVTLKGNTVNIKGDLPKVGSKAKDFTIVKDDLSEAKFSDFKDKVRVIIAVPSLDTGVCAAETRMFNQKLSDKGGVVGLVVSQDLPFAMKRFCETEGIENVVNASDFRYRQFMHDYNTEIMDGPLKGISARAVFVVDKDDTISFVELVPEITEEPNYDNVLVAIDKLLS